MRHHILLVSLLLPLCALQVGCVAEAPPNEDVASADALNTPQYHQRQISLEDNASHVAFTFKVKKWGILPADILYSLINVSAPADEVAIQRDEPRISKLNVGTITITRPNGNVKVMSLGALPDATGSSMRLFFDDAEEYRYTWAEDGDYQVALDKVPAFFSSLSMTFTASWRPLQP